MRKLILRNDFSLGDIVMLTAAVRDLHRCHPNRFLTDVRTFYADLWQNNPYLTPLDESDPDVEILDCHFPLIDRCDHTPYHCLHGFIEFLNDRLSLNIRPTAFQGDVHLSDLEKSWCSQVHEVTGEDTPFWIVVAGGKYDVTIKWWDARRYQEVVDAFRGKIQFVQVGDRGHHHPRLDGVIDLRGQTDLRQLVRLVYHAQGVLCGVTGLMHLAAAVEVKGGSPPQRPCVVVAGGREPVHWEAYPHHQFIHTIGALPCCATGGCWRARTVPLGDGDERDKPDSLCVDVVDDLPRCMDMITAADVIRRVETYFAGGAAGYLTPLQAEAAARGVCATGGNAFDAAPLTVPGVRWALDRFIKNMPPYAGGFRGRGIVICGGGVQLFTNAWVCVHMLRRLGCNLPIQLWHLGERELDPPMKALMAPLGVECVDAEEVRRRHPARILGGWELKPYALLYCPFREILLLDADNVPVVNPEFLFEARPYQQTGALFWPDFHRPEPPAEVWDFCGIPYRSEPPFETGQIVVDKERSWGPLCLTLWFNENSDLFYEHVHGDKETFHLAFRKLNAPFAMPSTPVHRLPGTMCQHDFEGNRVFQHRNTDKWAIFPTNKRVRGFRYEAECRAFLENLRERWDGHAGQYRKLLVSQPGLRHPRSRPPRPPRICAVMISCPERRQMRTATLRRLAATDWGEEPVLVQIDESSGPDRVHRIARTVQLALRRGLEARAEYLLLLEDDLVFNRHLLHNLAAWLPLKSGAVTLAGLYNPGIKALACDVKNRFFVADPRAVFGGQAFLLSAATVNFLLERWGEEAGPPDLRLPRLAARLGRPLFYHAPSLVQHVGRQSTWGGAFNQAADFDPDWKALRRARPNREVHAPKVPGRAGGRIPAASEPQGLKLRESGERSRVKLPPTA
jgi:ADP-heptose:LPS heptosyltransferase